MSISRRAFTIGLGAGPLLPAKAARPQTKPDSANPEATRPPSPKLFDDHELATVAAVAEVIIPATDTPGAREAHVAEYLDLILSDSPEPVRNVFLEGLWWTDGYCQRSKGAPFKNLPVNDQLRIVSELDESAAETNSTGREFVKSMKVWTARIYYSTEIGHQELNKGGRIPPVFFGRCES